MMIVQPIAMARAWARCRCAEPLVAWFTRVTSVMSSGGHELQVLEPFEGLGAGGHPELAIAGLEV